jgi:predicted nuclease with TOPRIM domain
MDENAKESNRVADTRQRTAARLADVVTEIRRLKAERKRLEMDLDSLDKVSQLL